MSRTLLPHPPDSRAILLIFGLVAGCVPSRSSTFAPVARQVEQRTGHQVRWSRSADADAAVGRIVQSLLATELHAETAVRIALLNNRNLQAELEELGISLAEVTTASTLSNPELDATLKFPVDGDGSNLEFEFVQDLLDLIALPQRRRAATAELEATRLRAVGAAVDLVAETRVRFYQAQSDAALVELETTVRDAAVAAYTLAKTLYEAGNTTRLAVAQERALLDETKLALSKAETMARESRERLNDILGLSDNVSSKIAPGLPELPHDDGDLKQLEVIAVDNSIDRAAERWRMEAAAGRIGVARLEAWLPRLGAGVTAEREFDGAWSVGPALTLSVPLFDRKQGARARGQAELRRAGHRYEAIAVRIRADARAARDRLRKARSRVTFLRDEVLPLRKRILKFTLLQYNAMNASPFELLAARREEIAAHIEYINALREFWTARTHIEQIRAGRMRGAMSAEGTHD